MIQASRTEAIKRLILALDAPSYESAAAVLARVENQVGVVKIGLELFTACGPPAIEMAKNCGYDVFLDLKLHDIPNTVAGAVRAARTLGVDMLTVHVGGGREMLESAAAAAGGDMQLLGVTLLTSLDAEDLDPVAIVPDPSAVVERRATVAATAGLAGIVCSSREIGAVRNIIGWDSIIVTPGIRPAGGALGDQKRIATPYAAITAGADYLVVGRPIHQAPNPALAAGSIVADIAKALGDR
ncbi:MAG: orotidine-5'-phosphate decarboxylase [Myxococcota bacterium]|nr:orotidine-5'-phosphate decarboxylase [Myxococcota bacterium]